MSLPRGRASLRLQRSMAVWPRGKTATPTKTQNTFVVTTVCIPETVCRRGAQFQTVCATCLFVLQNHMFSVRYGVPVTIHNILLLSACRGCLPCCSQLFNSLWTSTRAPTNVVVFACSAYTQYFYAAVAPVCVAKHAPISAVAFCNDTCHLLARPPPLHALALLCAALPLFSMPIQRFLVLARSFPLLP